MILWTMLDIKKLLGNRNILILAVIYSGVITFLFLAPSKNLPKVNMPGGSDKYIHFLIHLVLCVVWQLYLWAKNHYRLSLKKSFWILFGTLCYGILIELLQGSFTSTRTADIYDVLANFGGAALGVLLFQRLKHRLVT